MLSCNPWSTPMKANSNPRNEDDGKTIDNTTLYK